MNPIETLLEYVPTGTAEGERHLIEQVFVEQENFIDLALPTPHSPLLLVGKKGAGKTAFLDALSLFVLQNGIPVAKVLPSDLHLSKLFESDSVATQINEAYNELIRVIALRMANDLKGLVTGTDQVLLEKAREEGVIKLDFVGRLAKILPRLAKPIIQTDIDISSMNVSISEGALRKAVMERLIKSGSLFYVLIDDTDQVTNPTKPDYLAGIWGVLLAARKLAQDSQRLRVLVTIREEVWRRLTRSSMGLRDQVDHFDQLVRRLSPSKKQVEAIVRKRFERAQLKLGGAASAYPWRPFFATDMARMPSSSEMSRWIDIVVGRSRERPRDAIQLLSGLAKHAVQQGRTTIEQQDLDVEMPSFSARRVEYLVHESEAECPQIRKVVESLAKVPFDQGSFKISFQVIREFIKGLPNRFSISVYGNVIHADQDDDFLELLGLLFDLGVLNARISDIREPDGYRHIRPDESPQFVSRPYWNDLQATVWEVHPAFRDHLINVQAAESAGGGLASKPRR